ncbi:periplasmic nitrate reductase, diahem cytochrome C subunit [Nautilia profundicola AmH]|uniref:Periplasmic nitrate reductase, electron transfer subunit n=1 Tax=Nautilia profundicola (strain ATCC BAA-1463 / DSM 18972 / AmH) TaxID=598659 RepID=B9L8L1_NAUPA|nr:nitrate reductase cytochrome c-type subunit [Nautilia profundicola]ACM93211.1 periplasmic nitrate reductase, diahem cytochrome C subunit [Nautilia profundicola AmH]
MKKLLISSALIAGFIFTGCQTTTTSNKEVKVTGIREANLNADSQNLPELKLNTTQPIPGKVKKQPASFVTAPPMIPHSVEGMVPITKNNNMCLNCHMPQAAKSLGVTPIPPSHFVDNFEGGKKSSKLAGSRYNCTLCHAPQAMVDPVIENKFESLRK